LGVRIAHGYTVNPKCSQCFDRFPPWSSGY
jgi:hypothetical protein